MAFFQTLSYHKDSERGGGKMNDHYSNCLASNCRIRAVIDSYKDLFLCFEFNEFVLCVWTGIPRSAGWCATNLAILVFLATKGLVKAWKAQHEERYKLLQKAWLFDNRKRFSLIHQRIPLNKEAKLKLLIFLSM